MVFRGNFFLIFYLFLATLETEAQTVVADFSFPEKICVGEPFNITNTSTGGTSYQWNFCAKNLNQAPSAQSLGNPGGFLNNPMYMDIVFTNNNYYGFVTNFSSGDLVRLDFGTSLLNTPTVVNLGDMNGVLPRGSNSGIQVVQNEGRWYAIIVSGHPPGGINPRISKIDFGTSITNANPVGTTWGNLGNMYDPNDFIMVKEGTDWIGLTVNGETNTIVRFIFGSNFNNPPTATNMGDLGHLSEPSGLFYIEENGSRIVFIVNSGDEDRIHGQFEITRIDFGASLRNDDPNAVNIGNVSNLLQHPRDIAFVPACNGMKAFVVNGHPFYNGVLNLDFGSSVSTFPVADDLGNFGGFDYPHAITSFFTEGNSQIAFIINRESNTISRIVFSDCSNSSISTSTAQNPPAISYNQAGIYNVELTVSDGSIEEKICKELVVTACVDTIIITNDTTICAGQAVQIKTHPAISYQWSPADFLDDPVSASPTVTPVRNIKYYVDALMAGENLVLNGDFSDGNNDFNSAYLNAHTNVTEGEYFIGNDPRTWNTSLEFCADHTSGTGPMMLVNGSPTPGLTVWSQTINVKPNTDYGFSAWIQSIWTVSPAMISFRVNGTPLGAATTASATQCSWIQASALWNSGGNTSVTLSIVNENTAIVGNDFALDDISFSELVPVRDSVTITVREPSIKTNADTTICGGRPVQLTVSQGSSFTWSPAVGLSDPLAPNPVARPETTTEYIVRGVDAGGCPASDTVLISVNPSPVVTVTSDTTVCRGVALQLQASGGGTYVWTSATSLNSTTIPNPVTTALFDDAKFKLSVTGANGCTREDSVSVIVREYPQFAASAPTAVCLGTAINLQASGGDIYQWSPQSLFADASLSNITFTPSASEVYTVRISENVCQFDTTISLAVTVNPVPEITITKSNDINCTVPSAVLEASGAKNYLWSPAERVDDPESPRIISNADVTTSYTVTGSNEWGCSSTASVIVNVDNSGTPRFVVPNAFSPNGDGKNDCFGIQRWGYASIRQFSVYNRWGTLVFHTTNPSACWDGTWKGKAQEAGGYIYVIRAETICGEITRKGLITLVR